MLIFRKDTIIYNPWPTKWLLLCMLLFIVILLLGVGNKNSLFSITTRDSIYILIIKTTSIILGVYLTLALTIERIALYYRNTTKSRGGI